MRWYILLVLAMALCLGWFGHKAYFEYNYYPGAEIWLPVKEGPASLGQEAGYVEKDEQYIDAKVLDSLYGEPLKAGAPLITGMATYEPAIVPGDHVGEEDIHVYTNRFTVVPHRKLSWSKYAATKSMVPVLDENVNGIEFIPESIADIQVGDIISFSAEESDTLVVHRVIELGRDEKGWYAVTKGDNNPLEDPFRTRFENIKGVLVAIIY
ncbi:MAG: signal peptidase I [Candidatus Woesearchaeota archaeon]